MRWNSKGMILTGCVLLAAGPVRAAGSKVGLPVIQSRDFASMAAAMPVGSHLRLENVAVSDGNAPAALELERFRVFAEDAKITIHGDGGDQVLPAPANAYFRGTVAGKPESRVFLAQLEDGTTQGMVTDAEAFYLIGGDDTPAKALGTALEMRRVDPVLLKSSRNQGFKCAEDQLPGGHAALAKDLDLGLADVAAPLPEKSAAFSARVAIETDFEFYQLFNNATTATNYVGNVIGFDSAVYVSEINTSLVVQSVSLWTTSSDPWTQNNPLCGLLEFGKYWNQNKTGVSRTIAHFMSGKASGGGVAWLGVLCQGSFNTGGAANCPALGSETTPWGGAYGFTGNLFGNFNVNSPTVVWDVEAVAHEIGHNFNSPHSHCYNGIGGNASPIDQCYSGESGCYSGATSLPGPAGQGSGTIMSYCHLLGPGMSNVKMTFGNNQTYGVQPTREAARMSSHVTSVAAGNPSCLALVGSGNGIFSDGFETGTKALWQ